jgi:hypothetical protein
MGLNKPFNRNFFLIGGNVKTSGGSLALAKGQLAVVDITKSTATGLEVVDSFAGKDKNKKDFSIRLGIEKKKPGRSFSDKDFATMPFALNEVVGLEVSVPEISEPVVDEVVLGYDGTPGSEFQFKNGDSYFRIALKLTGGSIEWRGGKGASEFVGLNVEIPSCDPFACPDGNCAPCDSVDSKAIITEAVQRLRDHQLSGGNKVSDFIDVTPVFSCDNPITANYIPFKYFTIDVCDTGDDSAKAIVQAQYEAPVIRVARKGAISTYQMLLPSASTPTAFTTSLGSVLKGCESCPAGYTPSTGGYVYAFTIEDDGADQSASITTMASYVSGTVIKSGNSAGVGFYTALFSAKITKAQIATLVGTAGAKATATVDLVGKAADICETTATTTTAWVAGTEIINAVKEAYEIWVPDTSCGEARLAEVQAYYNNLDIDTSKKQTITLTGGSGSATINVGGSLYTITFATDLATTATNFVNLRKAALLDQNVVVTSSGAVLTFENVGGELPGISITTVAVLGGTVSAVSNVTAGCQTKYTTSVISNLVGDECNGIFKDMYITDAPSAFENLDWTAATNDNTTSPSGNCKTGIRFKSKVFVLDGDEALRERVGFLETSTEIQVAGGFPDEIREGIGFIPKTGFQGKYLSRKRNRTHLGGNLRHLEDESRAFFRNAYDSKDYLGRVLRGETSHIQDNTAQYVHYTLKVSGFNHSQGFAGRINSDVDYNFFVELGKHLPLEGILNEIAANAGRPTVKAFND